jgi:galactonate dehydratase
MTMIREAVGPDVKLLVDTHGRFDVRAASRLAEALHGSADIHRYEEPAPPESRHALQPVREAVGVPISVGERVHTVRPPAAAGPCGLSPAPPAPAA